MTKPRRIYDFIREKQKRPGRLHKRTNFPKKQKPQPGVSHIGGV